MRMVKVQSFKFCPETAMSTRVNDDNFTQVFLLTLFHCSGTSFELSNNSEDPLTTTVSKLCETSRVRCTEGCCSLRVLRGEMNIVQIEAWSRRVF
jgi:hypothetical protein